MTISPFTISVPDSEIDDLRNRLRTTRWADDFANADWSYGVEREWLGEMVRYWAADYDWREQEAAINAHPQFRTEIDGIPIHFLHVRGKGPNPVPLILTHGWPWTFWDWHALIGPLSDPAAHGLDPALSFDLIIPSLPGFGFSSPLRSDGVGARRTAELWAELMSRLGYERFAAGGGDFGAGITTEIAHQFPERVIGIYTTLALIPGRAPLGEQQAFAADEAWMEQRIAEAYPTIVSHVTVHTRDPQTLAYALNDSPVGLAAWIWERRRAWSDCDGDLLKSYDRDFLCTLISIYWFSRTIGSSMRFYRATLGSPVEPLYSSPMIRVPTGFGIAPKDVFFRPRALLEAETDLRRYHVFPRGGHFAPAEIPDLVVEEFRQFFGDLR